MVCAAELLVGEPVDDQTATGGGGSRPHRGGGVRLGEGEVGRKGRHGWNGAMFGGSAYQALTSFPGLIHFHGLSRTCASYQATAGLS